MKGTPMTASPELDAQCQQLRSLHVPGEPLLLPNAWDAATAKAVEAAGFPVVATTSGGVAEALGYEDHEGAPAEEMFAAAARIGHAVTIPMTVDAEAGYGMEPADLVAALKRIGAAGCNLEDTNHGSGSPREPSEQADWLGRVRKAARADDYGLVINARIDVFLSALMSGSEGGQEQLVDDALGRANAYLDAGADCVFPILLHEAETIRTFASGVDGAVNITALPQAPSIAELAKLNVARISYGLLLYRNQMESFSRVLASLRSAD